MIIVDGKVTKGAIKVCHILNIDPKDLLPQYLPVLTNRSPKEFKEEGLSEDQVEINYQHFE